MTALRSAMLTSSAILLAGAASLMVDDCICSSSGRISSAITDAFCTRVAPSRMSWLQPRDRGSSGELGIAITYRPSSAASRAVISDPDFGAAAITAVPAEIPAVMRLRQGKCLLRSIRHGQLHQSRAQGPTQRTTPSGQAQRPIAAQTERRLRTRYARQPTR